MPLLISENTKLCSSTQLRPDALGSHTRASPPSTGTDQVSLVYRSRAGLPKASETGVGLLVNEFRGRLLLRVSAQVYNTAEEYERLAAGLPALVGR